MLAAVTAGQLLAAIHATDYVTAAMSAQGVGSVDVSLVDAAMLAGVASDGRSLATALLAPQVAVLQGLAAGFEPSLALARGAVALVRLVATQVADAGRVGDGLAVVADPRCRGYYRRLTPPACSRCVVLAGKFFADNAGFDRHPQCDCRHVPVSKADRSMAFDGKAYFESLPAREQDRVFGADGAQAIRDGANLGQVVNARRGVATASIGGRQVLTTTEGVSKRGWYGYVQRALGGEFEKTPSSRYQRTRKPRLMPEQIYALGREFGWDRAELLRQLGRNGYLTDGQSEGPHPLARIAADVLRVPTAA